MAPRAEPVAMAVTAERLQETAETAELVELAESAEKVELVERPPLHRPRVETAA